MTTETLLNLTPGNMKAAMREADAGKSDMYTVPRGNIRVIPGFNVRTENAEYEAHVAFIGELILANGFRRDKPLTGYIAREGESNIVCLTDGHTRLRGVDYANARGAEINNIPFVTTPAGTSMEDLTIGLVVSNSGKQLAPLEKAMVCKRLIGYGMEEAAIAAKLGFSKGYVQDLLLLVASNKGIRDMVADGSVSASNAVAVIKKHGAEAPAVLGDGLEAAKASGKSKVTNKTLKPKSSLLDKGVEWIGSEGGWGVLPNQSLAGLLAHLAGIPVADVTSRLNSK